MYDFYVDEDKENRWLGVLAVPNAVALDQILQSIRGQYGFGREIHWNSMDKIRLPVAVSWIRVAAWYRGVWFTCLDWPQQRQKGAILVDHLREFLASKGTKLSNGDYDSVVFLDFDSADKKGQLHKFIAHAVPVLRCYPVDSKATNCLQLADILLGSWVRAKQGIVPVPPALSDRWVNVDQALRGHERLVTPDFHDAESKAYLSGYASSRVSRLLWGAKTGSRPAPPR